MTARRTLGLYGLGAALALLAGYVTAVSLPPFDPSVGNEADGFVAAEARSSPGKPTDPAVDAEIPKVSMQLDQRFETLERLRTLKAINARLNQKRQIPLFFSGAVAPDFAVWFGLSQLEVNELSGLLRNAAESVSALELRHMTIEEKDRGYEIRVPTFPVEGGAIFDQLLSGTQRVLGPERSGFLADFSCLHDGVTQFGQFGLSAMIIKLSTSADAPPPLKTWKRDPGAESYTREFSFDLKLLQQEFPLLHQVVMERERRKKAAQP